jgi:putative PIN family toxin of toxin-antitoxin system
MRVVLDTNVLIAAFIARGVCADLLEHCVLHHAIISSSFILDELRRHLTGKFKFADQDADEALNLLRSKFALVVPATLETPVCRDPDDDAIVATAVAGNADCMVTGDKDLLVLQRFGSIEIVSPSQFADFEARQSGEQAT